MRKQLTLTILSVLLVLSSVAMVSGLQTFTVPAHSQQTQTVTLNQGDQVTGNINVTGGLTNDINFNITCPEGNTLVSYSLVTQTPFDFTAPVSGTYIFIFENPALLLSKSVTLDYTVKPATLGIPQDKLPLVLGAIIFVVAGIALGLFLISKRKAMPQAK